jgi:hypothetical protein
MSYFTLKLKNMISFFLVSYIPFKHTNIMVKANRNPSFVRLVPKNQQPKSIGVVEVQRPATTSSPPGANYVAHSWKGTTTGYISFNTNKPSWRELGQQMIERGLSGVSREEQVSIYTEQLDAMEARLCGGSRNGILNPYIVESILSEREEGLWRPNIEALLQLGAIQNDDMYGTNYITDHNGVLPTAPAKRTHKRTKPNEPCECGSGKKAKKCCHRGGV